MTGGIVSPIMFWSHNPTVADGPLQTRGLSSKTYSFR